MVTLSRFSITLAHKASPIKLRTLGILAGTYLTFNFNQKKNKKTVKITLLFISQEHNDFYEYFNL